MKAVLDRRSSDGVDERLRALARMLGRLAARQAAIPLSQRASNSHRSDLPFNAEGDLVDE